ncbi:hypothetical protein EYB53_005485 [Candidatus Chloroploca sp. M-50]|uniref:Uncharacterized protein n=1 Tax=Candidatus Chloroploca mongolica TaxID=2528176 RepID=A0ABS4D6V0_9CHLR|nr:hypothetical protein [Candidatus Chloroploca mongolica]MBP1465153.1 hypothetical protein [Candidatus Chloroploca mongolica]
MSVLEIHAENFVNDDFKEMCGEWSFGFDRLACRPDNTPAPQASIWINPEQLKLKIEQMLNQPYKTAAPPQQA